MNFKEMMLAAYTEWFKTKAEAPAAPAVEDPAKPEAKDEVKTAMEADTPAEAAAPDAAIEARFATIEDAIQKLVEKINAMDSAKPVAEAMSAIGELKTTVEKMQSISSAKHIGAKETVKVSLAKEKTGNDLVDAIRAKRNNK